MQLLCQCSFIEPISNQGLCCILKMWLANPGTLQYPAFLIILHHHLTPKSENISTYISKGASLNKHCCCTVNRRYLLFWVKTKDSGIIFHIAPCVKMKAHADFVTATIEINSMRKWVLTGEHLVLVKYNTVNHFGKIFLCLSLVWSASNLLPEKFS